MKKYIALGLVAITFFALAYIFLNQPRTIVVQPRFGLAPEYSSDAPEGVEVTVYQLPSSSWSPGPIPLMYFDSGFSSGLALVKEKRAMNLPAGNSVLSLKNTAAHIDATSVGFKDLTDAGAQVLEQRYLYDLVSNEKLLEKYLDKEITVTKGNESITGTLLSHGNGLILKTAQGIVSLTGYDKIRFPDLPEGLITTPTMEWLLKTAQGGSHDIQFSYLTSGINWRADYVATVGADEKSLDLKSWVSVRNDAGASFKDAKLKLIAGDINLVQEATGYDYNVYAMAKGMMAEAAAAPAEPQFTSQQLFEYHLYSLERPTTIADGEVKQITLFDAKNIPAEKKYVVDQQTYYYYQQSDSTKPKVQVKMVFYNKKDAGLGMALPKGKIRVYEPDEEGQLQFLGEDAIDHTAEGEKITVFVGNAFDVTAEKTQTDYKRISSRVSQYSYSVKISNAKKEAVQVQVFDYAYGDWQIISESLSHVKESAHKMSWLVSVPAGGSTTLTYTIQQTW
jgi:hypothetical protein